MARAGAHQLPEEDAQHPLGGASTQRAKASAMVGDVDDNERVQRDAQPRVFILRPAHGAIIALNLHGPAPAQLRNSPSATTLCCNPKFQHQF